MAKATQRNQKTDIMEETMNVKLTIDEYTEETTLAHFLDANADSMEESEAVEIRGTLLAGGTYSGGGGAEPEWTLTAL